MIEVLYNQYFHDVFLYLKAISHSDDIAEELTQETFFKALKTSDSFSCNSSPSAWRLSRQAASDSAYPSPSAKHTVQSFPLCSLSLRS